MYSFIIPFLSSFFASPFFVRGWKMKIFEGASPPRGAMSAISPAPQDDHSGGLTHIRYKTKQKNSNVKTKTVCRLTTHATTKTMILGYCRLFEKGQINLLWILITCNVIVKKRFLCKSRSSSLLAPAFPFGRLGNTKVGAYKCKGLVCISQCLDISNKYIYLQLLVYFDARKILKCKERVNRMAAMQRPDL